MRLESIRGNQNGEYDRLEDPRWVHGPIWLAILSVLLDRLVTVLFWGYEANPLVNQLGVYNWVLLTFILIAGMLCAWYPGMGVKNGFVRVLVWCVALTHLLAAGSNLYVVFF